MAQSKVRSSAKSKKQAQKAAAVAERRAEKEAMGPSTRNWVPWVFIPVGLLGVLWMVVWNLAGRSVGFMNALGDWNILIGLGLIVASFSLMTLWK